MEIRVYDAEFNLQKIVENFISLLWHRRYNEAGEFEIKAPATEENIACLVLDNVVWIKGKVEAGVIESRIISQDSKTSEIIVSGRFLESYMDRRLIRPKFNYSGLTEVGMRTILENAVALPMVELGELQGFEDEITFQATYKNLLSYESKLAKKADFGFRFRPDFVNKKIYFEVYKGVDHGIEQSDRARVIFSEEFVNLASATFNQNSELYKNVGYVGGEGEGDARTYVTVGDDTLTGLERREVFFDAADISSEDLTEEQYKAKLSQRGEDRLVKDNPMATSFECETNPNGNFKYGIHYDLGDVVTVQKKSWGLYMNERITEITEVYENGVYSIEPIFGTTIPETIDWED